VVTTPGDEEGRRFEGANTCAGCGGSLREDQKYCLECGARRGPLPRAVAAQLASLERRKRDEAPPTPDAEPDQAEKGILATFMPSPRAAAVAVMGMLAFGVMLGSAISPLAHSAGLTSILFEAEPPPTAPSEPEETATAEAEAEAPEEAFAEPSSVIPPEVVEEGVVEEEEGEEPPPPPPTLPEVEELPEVKHVFVIVLGENGYEETFGAASTAPYLSKKLLKQGELLPNYYAVAGSDLANQVALISGQGPTAETAADCPNYADLLPGTESVAKQVEGNGCVYPASTETLPGQLAAANLKWKAYVEGVGSEQEPTCRHPALGAADPSHALPTNEGAPVPGVDPYLTWRNPFVYFHSLLDGGECAGNDVGFERLASDLKLKAAKAPALSYIVPNACHSGGPVPCEPEKPTGPAASEELLKTLVPQIMASAAYKEGGLIAITSALAPQSGEHADASSCCALPSYPNLPPLAAAPPAETAVGGVKASGGGGRVGMLLISPFVEPGTVAEAGYYDHFSFLRTVEELFGLTPLGYAGEPALSGFEPSLFNAAAEEEEEEEVVVPKTVSRAGSAGPSISRARRPPR
jgi:phosphatidylinositol-3-phosphatase